jgi:hypothetical protein
MSYTVIDTPSGAKSLVFRGEREIKLHSAFDPVKEAERAAAQFSPGKKNVIVSAGTALGYHLPILRKKFPGIKIAAIDDPRVFDIARKTVPGNLEGIICVSSDGDLDLLFEGMDISAFRGIAVYTHRPSYQMDPEFYDGILTGMNRYISSKISDLLTRFEFEEKWAENIIRNMPAFFRARTAADFFGAFKGYPGIIVSAGPSLKKNAHLLEKVKGRALICCVDTSFRVLHRMGIRPHIVMTLDAQKHSIRHFLGIPDSSPVLIADMVSYPKIAGRYEGTVAFSTTSKFYCGENGELKRETTPLMDWIEKYVPGIGDVQSGGSVATSLFDFLLSAGCSEIVLIGQDLAYTGREIHTGGTYHNDEWLTHTSRLSNLDTINQKIVRKRKIKYVPAWGGGSVITDYVMDLYKQWFEDSVEKVSIPVINATEGGSRIRGAEEITFSEWIERAPSRKEAPAEIIGRIIGGGKNSDAGKFIAAVRNALAPLTAFSSMNPDDSAGIKQALAKIKDPSFGRLLAPFLKKTNAYLNRHPELDDSKADGLLGRDIVRASGILRKELSKMFIGMQGL